MLAKSQGGKGDIYDSFEKKSAVITHHQQRPPSGAAVHSRGT